jgi:hypothetical protein
MDWTLITPVVTLLAGSGAGYFFTRMSKRQDNQSSERIADRLRIVELERQVALVGQAIVPISAAFQAILIKELTHIHTPVLDRLLEKVGPPSTLTTEDQINLEKELTLRANDMSTDIPDGERDAALMLPMVIRRAQRETALPQDQVLIKVVSVLPDSES